MPEYKTLMNKSNNEYNIEINSKIVNENKSSTIKINNLPNDIRVKELLDIYEFFGRIDDRGVTIKNYRENTIAFIKYTTNENALKAIESTNCKKLGYCVLNVELANN